MTFTLWLTILFVGLKLTNFIAWSWLWVVSPVFIGLFVISLIGGTMGVIAYIANK